MTSSHHGLTHKQKKILNYIETYFKANRGVSPSYSDIEKATGERKSYIGVQLNELELRGHITRIPNKARTIRPLFGQPPFVEAMCTNEEWAEIAKAAGILNQKPDEFCKRACLDAAQVVLNL